MKDVFIITGNLWRFFFYSVAPMDFEKTLKGFK